MVYAELEVAVIHWPFSIFQPIFTIWPSKFNLLSQIYCTFSMGKPLIVYSNVPAFKKWSTCYFKLFICDLIYENPTQRGIFGNPGFCISEFHMPIALFLFFLISMLYCKYLSSYMATYLDK